MFLSKLHEPIYYDTHTQSTAIVHICADEKDSYGPNADR